MNCITDKDLLLTVMIDYIAKILEVTVIVRHLLWHTDF
jgi:hypothetical protein